MVTVVNSKADVLKNKQAMQVNLSAAMGLQEVMKSNFGPRGTLKMLVGGAGQIKITKDGSVLLHEMQIQHPTAAMIARAATAQDDMTGDGTASNVLFIGELLKLSESYLSEGLHPRMICRGIDIGREETLKFLEKFKVQQENPTREILLQVAKTSLRSKLQTEMADALAAHCTDSALTIRREGEEIDLHMIEVMAMKQGLSSETRLVKGLVLDHGARHADMPKKLKNCYILTLNVSLEYEKTEVNAGFYYSTTEQRDKLADSERKFTDEKCRKIIELKRKVCTPENGKSFVVLNQKGVDPASLEMFAREGIIALRRAKRRNMERLVLACGGNAANSVDDLEPDDLGFAELVYEEALGDDKFTFVEGVKNAQSCTILIKGPNEHSIHQIKDAIRDGLRAVKNTIEDKALVPGAGSFEIAASLNLENFKKTVKGKPRLGVEIFAKALLVVPKVLIENSGLDVQEKLLELIYEYENSKEPVGVDLMTGDPMSPSMEGIWDNYMVKKQMFNLGPVLAQQLLLVDEIIRAGVNMKGNQGP